MIIGITGYYGSGKDSVANYLVERSFIHYSLSDEIREELKKRKIKITRKNLIKLGNELRKKEGPSCLANRVKEKIDTARHHVITSIRNKNEVLALKRLDNFLLINLKSPIEQRFERLKKRNREEDPKTIEELKQKELQEQSSNIEHQQLHLTVEMADVIMNNDSTLDILYKKIDKFLQDWWPKLCLERPSWDEYFMNIAHEVAKRSDCMKRHTAAVIVKDKRIISTGYNGAPKGLKNCNEGGCKRCNSFGHTGEDLGECICSHAEENSIVQAAYHGISVKDTVLYTTQSPCVACTKLIINSGIKEVICNLKYPMDKGASDLLRKSHVKVRFL
ncbi:AAA family ATPase [Candidatus Woesearchaeota archaeon]|jgi:dCMP deaminase|nr:AAA family ATPase [Candidatus Woesearchaeota archaeon]MBT4321650.1 AAA family ATPase [Candidatus Woesearchaeota archaeon]MBT4631039.1 AAA family ATPase [Candidatus Woesearchaeota archaeon]